MKSVILQFQEALLILEDYPGIENILDISQAKDLLQNMKNILDIPSMEEAHMNLEKYRTEMKEKSKKWEALFDELPLTGIIVNCVEEEVDMGEDVLLYIPFHSSLSNEAGTGVPDCSLSLFTEDEAGFDVDALNSKEAEAFSETCTWKEAYKKLSSYVLRKTEVPE